ncbi:hypothetical protein Dsin_018527 [Dipteronia sinensis]|uniref:Pentatricopeptide repeat-containing protein n=1 Tax=Dipteronia sinensis TaxID=43782 RepID=A0AAE0A707_9ROSI|nr:hypothetical protein Dsin_018527 [Dipteronia sinensis]
MLCKAKHGGLSFSSNLFKIFSLCLHSSSLSPNPDLKTSKNPKATSKRPISLSTQDPRIPLNSVVISSDATNICSLLLSDRKALDFHDFDRLLKGYKDKLNSNLVLEILMNYRQLGRMKTLEFFSWAGMQMGFQFDDCVTEYMADFLGRRKLFDDMKCFLLTLLSHKGQVSSRVFSICIRFLGRQGRIREALCLFQEMETKFSCKPDNFVYNNMLYVLCKKEISGEYIDVALGIFRMIESPDNYSYSNIIVGLCKFRRFENALEVFLEMGRAGLVPTRSAVNALLGDLSLLSAKEGAIGEVRVQNARRPFTILVPNVGSKNKSGAIEPATRVFWAVYGLGLLPSSFVIIRLIKEQCRLGKMEEAFEILKVVDERKLTCLEESYSIVMQNLCERRLVEEASHLFGRMLSRGLKPKLVVYNSVVSMLCKVGRLDDAKRVFEIMNKNKCLPDNVIYTALVHAYGEVGNWEAACGLLIEMLGFNLIPHFHTFSFIEKLLMENGPTDLSIKLEKKLEAQILLKYCKLGQLEAAYEKLKSMIEKGIYPPPYVKDAFEQKFQKSGRLKIARQLLEKMDEECRSQKQEIRSF